MKLSLASKVVLTGAAIFTGFVSCIAALPNIDTPPATQPATQPAKPAQPAQPTPKTPEFTTDWVETPSDVAAALNDIQGLEVPALSMRVYPPDFAKLAVVTNVGNAHNLYLGLHQAGIAVDCGTNHPIECLDTGNGVMLYNTASRSSFLIGFSDWGDDNDRKTLLIGLSMQLAQ